jgi:hypothetical protein
MPSSTPRPGEYYIAQFKVHVLDFESNPYGIEWMRYEADSPMPEIIKNNPHIAFEVDDLEAEIAGKEIIIPPNSPSKGVTVAFIIDHGMPIEFLKFEK